MNHSSGDNFSRDHGKNCRDIFPRDHDENCREFVVPKQPKNRVLPGRPAKNVSAKAREELVFNG
jgi:hypothetical protein